MTDSAPPDRSADAPVDPLATPYRTHTCGALRATDAGSSVRLAGWVHRRRDHGQLIFLDLRDRHGITQVVIDRTDDPDAHAVASRVRSEFVVMVDGDVAPRLPGTENGRLPTGAIELRARAVSILSESKTPPFYVNDPDAPIDEALRLRYAAAAAAEPPRPGDSRGPSRPWVRRGRDAEPDQVDARGGPGLHRPVTPAAG
jgi:lysyl-tRNA synthetase class II